MIKTLHELIPDILTALGEVDSWTSVIINRRKPNTYRVWRMFGENRVCLHTFNPCEENECFAHPHPWPGAFLMLKGEYVHRIGCSNTLNGNPQFIYTEIVRPYSTYEISSPFTWHSVQPLKKTWTIMVNGPEFKKKHRETRTTKGKDLEQMTRVGLMNHLVEFDGLFRAYTVWYEENQKSSL